MSRSMLTDLFHQSASVLLPLSQHLLQCTASADVVWADETPLRVLDVKRTKLGYLWTFLTQNEEGEWLIGYRFIRGWASKTPKEVLGGTSGALVVDAYTGYNAVTLPQGPLRVGCWAHVRRRFVDALATAPEAREALDFILELYRVEAQARDADMVRTAAHRELRQLRSAPVLAQLHAWLEAQAPRHPPKSPLGQAISYVRQQWEALTRFVENERLPLDNNRSEAVPEKSGRRWREGPGALSAAVQRRPGQPGRGEDLGTPCLLGCGRRTRAQVHLRPDGGGRSTSCAPVGPPLRQLRAREAPRPAREPGPLGAPTSGSILSDAWRGAHTMPGSPASL
ncbi:IS66 family transposase [Myxococcus xanthus]|uniref:IS66 family transposase n=1 Tax=Myxococcus xanthus TaxID=34 RepID=UPI0013755792|nr:IS66 family transposase [Myxococcus xanthus]